MNDRRTHPPDGSEPRGGSGEHPGDARESERLLRALRGAVPVETAEKVAARRRVLVAAIGREIEAVPARIARQERRRRWLRSASVAAATLVLTLTGTTLWRAGWGEPAEVAQLETSDTPSEGQALVTLITPHGTRQDVLSTGQELTVARGEKVDAQLPGATRFHFEPLVNHEPQVNHEPLVNHEAQGSREAQVQALNGKQQGATPLHSAQGSLGEQAVLQLSQLRKQNQSLFVKSGVLSVDVPENKAMRRLVTVVTPHARVEVKGTQFQVQVSEGAGAHTSVSVSRGSVSVSWLGGHTLLTRGQTWDSQNMTHVPKLSFAEPSGAPHGITGPAQ
ncbi:MAG TPA: FecR domain-containing protein, partial [Polyangiaceae bacterium]|nr:FecR domain-containing protein [Polyangiaceae bacterium]